MTCKGKHGCGQANNEHAKAQHRPVNGEGAQRDAEECGNGRPNHRYTLANARDNPAGGQIADQNAKGEHACNKAGQRQVRMQIVGDGGNYRDDGAFTRGEQKSGQIDRNDDLAQREGGRRRCHSTHEPTRLGAR